MLIIRFIDPSTSVVLFDLPVVSASLDVGLNQSTRWNAVIDANIVGISDLYRGMTVEWYVAGTLIFEGLLQDFTPNIAGQQTLTLNGRSFTDNLYTNHSFRPSYYDNDPLLGVMTELLVQADWELGDVGTMTDIDQTITTDLRGERNLLTQVNKLISNIPFSYWREGEKRLGKRTLDIGIFQADSGLWALKPGLRTEHAGDDDSTHIITALSYQVDFTNAVRSIAIEGGEVTPSAGVNRQVTLGDAITLQPLLRIDEEFPIIEDLNEQQFSVLNLRDYPYPGGRVMSTDNAKTTVAGFGIGDTVGGAVENWRHIMMTFIPYPGLLRHITVWFGTQDVAFGTEYNAGNFEVYWKIFELDPADSRILGALVYSDLLDSLPFTNEVRRLIPSSELILEPGKHYGLVMGTTIAPTADVVRLHIQCTNRANTSPGFHYRVFNNVLPTTASVALASNLIPVIEVVTDRIGINFAGVMYEKQPKFAPPKTGGVTVAAEMQRAALSMYEWSLNYFNEHPPQKREFDMTTKGSKRLPKPGDTIHVVGTARVEFYDSFRGQVVYETTEAIDDDLRISSYSVNFQGDDIDINYKLLDDDGVIETERLVALYDETADKEPPTGAIFNSPYDLLLDTINVTITNELPNASFADGTDAFEVTVDIHDGSVATLPGNTEWVWLAGNPYGVSPQGDLRIEVTVAPEFVTNSPITFLVGFRNRGWQYGDSADLTLKLIWR